MRKLVLIGAAMLLAVPAFAANLAFVPMDAQINNGYTYSSQSPNGDAIYPAFNTDTQAFLSEAGVGFTRHNLVAGGGAGGWYYQYVDLNLAGVTTPGAGLDLSAGGTTVSFDARYFQDPDTNTDPYGDAPIFLRLYTYDADGDTYLGHRDFSIVYATQGPWSNPPYPDWSTVVVDVNTADFTDGGTFDIHNVSRVRWYGTDWSGAGGDFVDFKNLSIDVVPEPSSLLILAVGLGSLPFFRKRK